MATWQSMNWQRAMYGPYGGIDVDSLYQPVRNSPVLPAPTLPEPEILPAAYTPEPLQAPVATGDQQFDVTRLAQDIAYGHSDWERAGRAIVGAGPYEDASFARRAGAVAGGVGLGALALASWIPGFNVFKPAQAARAARAFGQGAARGADEIGSVYGAVRTGYRDAGELERQRRAAVAAKKAADRPVSQAGVATDQGRVYDVQNFRANTLDSDFPELERLALQTNLQQKTIDAVRVGRQGIDPSHPLRNADRLLSDLEEGLGLLSVSDPLTGSRMLAGRGSSPGWDNTFIYTLGDSNPRIINPAKINPSGPAQFFTVPEITPDFIDFHSSFQKLAQSRPLADSVNPERFVEGLLRRPGNAILGNGDDISVVSLFDNMDEAFSAAAARGRPYIFKNGSGGPIPVPDSYWPDRTVGKNILAKYGSQYSPVSGKLKTPSRSLDQAGEITWRSSGPVDQIPRGSNANVMARIIREQGFDRLPKLATPEDIARLESEGHIILHRGLTSVDNPAQNIRGLLTAQPPQDNSRSLEWAKNLFTGKFYAGTGSHGAGVYFTPHVQRAASYTEGYGSVVTMALPPNARIMGPGEYRQLGNLVRDSFRVPGQPSGQGLIDGFKGTPTQMDMGRLVAMLGYDGYIPYDTVFGYSRPEFVLLNRSIATFSKVPREIWGGLRGAA